MAFEKLLALRSLLRSKKILKRAFRLYRSKERELSPIPKLELEAAIAALQTALWKKEPLLAAERATDLESLTLRHITRTRWDRIRDSLGGLAVALLIAVAVRQMWFEFYSIPTGSMRPTLKEGDYLAVSKTDFGVNTLFRSGHFYFDPTLVERGSIVVFNGEQMNMPNDETVYFLLIPGKKQYIKRLIGKPGDTLYFYGGKIYGINGRGADLKELRDAPYLEGLEHIPFIRFEGRVEPAQSQDRSQESSRLHSRSSSVLLYQMNQPIAKLSETPIGGVKGELLPQRGKPLPTHYSDLWGFKNYAMARLLTKEQLEEIHPRSIQEMEKGALYLELHHHPSLQNGRVLRDDAGHVRPGLQESVSLLPLSPEHLDALSRHMTTCRFEVREGRGYRLGSTSSSTTAPLIAIPDGTYEMQDGKAFRILWSGFEKELSPEHPIFSRDAAHIQTLYNLGIEWQTYYQPSNQAPLPSRYAYFRQGDLYLMNGPILKKGDPFLTLFLKREYQKQAMSTSVKPYFPFDDGGPPLTQTGTLDVEFIKKFGITIPEKMYLVLGDNHAMSADSRYFGFVPQNNLRGGAGPLFWPPGPRWGALPQAFGPKLSFPNLAVWSLAALAALAHYIYSERKYMKPLAREGQSSKL